MQAIGRGAYDTICLAEKDGEQRLLARLRELFLPEPQLKAPPGFIASRYFASRSSSVMVSALSEA